MILCSNEVLNQDRQASRFGNKDFGVACELNWRVHVQVMSRPGARALPSIGVSDRRLRAHTSVDLNKRPDYRAYRHRLTTSTQHSSVQHTQSRPKRQQQLILPAQALQNSTKWVRQRSKRAPGDWWKSAASSSSAKVLTQEDSLPFPRSSTTNAYVPTFPDPSKATNEAWWEVCWLFESEAHSNLLRSLLMARPPRQSLSSPATPHRFPTSP